MTVNSPPPPSRQTGATRLVQKRFKLRLAALLLVAASAGCGTVQARFPAIPVKSSGKATPKSTVGIARVEDSRANDFAGEVAGADLLVGNELPDYIGIAYRNELTAHGIASVEAPNPAVVQGTPDHNTLVVTLQSVSCSIPDTTWSKASASADIAVQVYGARTRNVIFAAEFLGTINQPVRSAVPDSTSGGLIAAAADKAIKASFKDPKFMQALR